MSKPTYQELEQRVTELEQRLAQHEHGQRQMQEAHRMQAISTLAGGIAHQFNNSLASITLSMDLIRMDLSENDSLLSHLNKMRSSTEKMAHLTSQLLAYAEGGRYQTSLISMRDFLNNALPSVIHQIRPSARVDTDLPLEAVTVKADASQLQMVLSAVIHNSVEAIESEGRIRVSVKNEIIGKRFADAQDLAPGPYVCLAVEDNGKGMDEQTRKRIFEPFFTTKFHGRGLGLPAVYGIVKAHQGCVVVDSIPGKGTTVRIYLPAVEVRETKSEVKEREPLEGAGTLLIVEDDGSIMNVSRKLLERIGYRVLTARSGKEALSVSGKFKGRIDLVLLDVVLPDMGGKEIYDHLLAMRPRLKVLVCSGYSVEGPARDILDAGAQGFIQKPFSFRELNGMLQDILKQVGNQTG